MGHPVKAKRANMRATIRELEAKLIRVQSATECLATLLALSELHAGTHRYREGLRCAREALNIARARQDAVAAARALTAASRCHYQRGDYVSAAAAAIEAVEAFGDSDPVGRSNALRSVALTLLEVEAYELAEIAAERATADALQAGDAGAEACARQVWGMILAHRDRFGAARRKFREAGAIQRRLGETLELKKSASNIGHGYRDEAKEAMARGERERARMLWRHAIRVYRVALGTGTEIAEDALIYAAIAQCECRLEDPQAALLAIRHGLSLAAQSVNPLALAHCHLWESHALKAMNRLEAARRSVERAREAAEQLDHDPVLAECLKAESALSDLGGRFESAHDLETRAEQVLLERTAFIARLREDLAALLARHRDTLPPLGEMAA